jgi:DNA-binding transcriptional ArsR family regulator
MSAEVRLEVDDSPVYEVILSLLASSRPDELVTDDLDGPSARTLRPIPSARLQRAIDRLGGRRCPWDQFVGFAAEMPPPRTVARFLDYLEQAEPIELLLQIAGFYAEPLPHHVRAALIDAAGGSRAARDAAVAALCPSDPERQAALSRVLDLALDEVQELIATCIRQGYAEVFTEDESTIVSLLAADADAKRALLTTTPELLIRITTGVRYIPKPWIESVLLVPTIVMRPWLVGTDYKRVRIYCYSIADDAPSSPALPPPPVVRMYRALGHATRLRIIKRLAARPLTVAQLCRELDTVEPALRPHLAVLRAARLVEITCADVMTYELRDDLLGMVGQPLEAYLHSTPPLPLPKGEGRS